MRCCCRLLTVAVVLFTSTTSCAREPSAQHTAGRPQQPRRGPPRASSPSWPQFLGPRRDGISHETGLNLDWQSRRPKLLWKVPLGGGFSSTSIAGGRLFTMAKRGNRDIVVCFDAKSGQQLWTFDGAPSFLDIERKGAGPRATPTYENGRIYCFFPRSELVCLEARSGRLVWKTNVFDTAGTGDHSDKRWYWGMAGSPLIEGELLIVQPGGDKDNSLVAFDKNTGKLVWGAGSDPPGYGSPIAITAHGRRQVIGTTGAAVISVDPADGKLLWRYPWGRMNCNCATPLWIDGKLFISSAYGAGSALLEIVEHRDALALREVWHTTRMQNHFPTSMIVDGHVYGCHGDLGTNTLRCIELSTGKQKWIARGTGKCSLLATGRHLICVSESGTIRLLEANPERYVEKAKLDGLLTGRAWAPPVLLNRRLYVRDEKHLVCLDLAAE